MPLPEHLSSLLDEGATSSHRNFLTSRDPVREAEKAGWNAAATISDYMKWCTEAYPLKLSMYGRPYHTEMDDDPEQVELVSDLFTQAVSVSGLRTVRFKRPNLEDTMDRNPYLENPVQEEVFLKKFYGQLKSWHHGARMNELTVTKMLEQIPSYIDTISYQAPDMTRTVVTGQAFIGERQMLIASADRPFGQRGGGHAERPANTLDGRRTRDIRVPRIGRQIIHIATNQDKFDFNTWNTIGYVPHRGLGDQESTEEQLSIESWQGWEEQPWTNS